MISINSFLPTPVSLSASAAVKFGILSYGCSAIKSSVSEYKHVLRKVEQCFSFTVTHPQVTLFYQKKENITQFTNMGEQSRAGTA